MSLEQEELVSQDCERVYGKISQKLEELENVSILVTGGSGFLGSWIAELVNHMNTFHNKNIKLFLLDRDSERFETNLKHISKSNMIEFIECDIRSISDLPNEVNYIIHGAAPQDRRFLSSSPLETMNSICDATSAILHSAARLSNLVKFINISASYIYQDEAEEKISLLSEGLPLDLKPSNAHSEAKRYSEMLGSAARSEMRIPVITVRPFTFCGAYQDINSPWALNNFIKDSLNKRPIKILGDGATIRSYMYGADFAAWTILILLTGKIGNIYNLGSDCGISLRELAEKVSRFSKFSPEILLNSSLTGSVKNTILVPDMKQVFDEFGLTHLTDIDTAIDRTIKWYELGFSNIT